MNLFVKIRKAYGKPSRTHRKNIRDVSFKELPIMVFDTELFIVEIHKRPSLWYIDTEEYADKKLKYQCWGEVGEIMFPDFVKLDDKLKVKKIRELKKKWKGLRDYYKRDSKTIMKPGFNGKKRKTVCLDLLQFLSVTVSKRASSIHTDIQTNESSPEHETEESSSFRRQYLEQYSHGDADMNFLLNILPDMKSMSARQNFEFRFGVMQLIKDIKYSDNIMPKAASHNPEKTTPNTNIVASGTSPQGTEYCDIHVDIKRSPSSDESVTSTDDAKGNIIRFPEDNVSN